MHTDSDTNSSVQETKPLETLYSEIEKLKETSNFLLHRLDSIKHELEQNSFPLADHPIQIAPTKYAAHVRLLLTVLNLEEPTLTVGNFLKALNIYLIQNDLVDLNDLQILLNPLLKSAFQKPLGLKKVPYGLLLNTLPQLFI